MLSVKPLICCRGNAHCVTIAAVKLMSLFANKLHWQNKPMTYGMDAESHWLNWALNRNHSLNEEINN